MIVKALSTKARGPRVAVLGLREAAELLAVVCNRCTTGNHDEILSFLNWLFKKASIIAAGP